MTEEEFKRLNNIRSSEVGVTKEEIKDTIAGVVFFGIFPFSFLVNFPIMCHYWYSAEVWSILTKTIFGIQLIGFIIVTSCGSLCSGETPIKKINPDIVPNMGPYYGYNQPKQYQSTENIKQTEFEQNNNDVETEKIERELIF